MDIFVVGVVKNRKKIAGFKVLCIGNNNAMETRDVSYDQMVGALNSNPQMFKNIKMENGELKGINGSLDRYGECGKSQALVIINEIKSPSGQLLGYFCADTLGRTKELSENDAINIANSVGIANGKLVPDNNGRNYISCIEGSYRAITRQQKTPAQPVSQGENNNANKENTVKNDKSQLEDKLASLSDNDKKLISDVKTMPNFGTSLSKSIIDTIVQKRFITDKQRYAMRKEYEASTGNKVDIQDVSYTLEDVKNIITELKTYKEYDKSFSKSVVKYIEKYGKCSGKQKYALDKDLEKFRASGTKKREEPVVQVEKASVQENNTKVENAQTVEPVNDTKEEVTKTQSVDEALSVSEEKVLREVENKKREALQEAAKQAKIEEVKQAHKRKERIGITILTDDVFDYSLHKENGINVVYIEGFHDGVDTNMDLIIPETTDINGKSYRIVGIAIDAFCTTHITSVKTTANIKDIGAGAFKLCGRLENVDLSASRHAMIASYAFYGCTSLEEVLVGYNVQRVHEHAFENCIKLKNIALPECCGTIARSAFSHCHSLESISHRGSMNIDWAAFEYCSKLREFDFTGVTSIGTKAFFTSGLKEITISSSVREVGEKAFADCPVLSKVVIEEGVEVLRDYAFSKSQFKSRTSENAEATRIEEIYAPRSLKEIGMDAFRHAGVVIGYIGTTAESKCITFGTPFRALDAVNTENSTRVRIKSNVLGSNPIETLKADLDREIEGASNPSNFEMHTGKLLNATVSEDVFKFLKLGDIQEEKEPHVKFKGAVNYLQDVAENYQTPLFNTVLRLQETFNVISEAIYDDGFNKIYKITYEIMDTLDSGSFIIVTQGYKIQFMCDCNLLTDIICDESLDNNLQLPVTKHLHSGDILGENSTIDGKDAILKDEIGTRDNVGKRLALRIEANSITIEITRKDSVVYIPADNVALELHDRTKDKLEEDAAQAKRNKINARYRREEVISNKTVISVMTYEEFIKHMNAIKKATGGYTKFFNDLASLSESAVKSRIINLKTIEDEKEAHLFEVSKQYVEIVNNSSEDINPNLLTYKLLNDLTHSYWIVSKDENWYRSIGTKSLNKTAEYYIGQYKLIEYKSNQIVKFSNPYMNGKKGAYVFTLMHGNNVLGVYTSRNNIQRICEKLYELTYIEPGVSIPESIMSNPRQFDNLDSKLFYPFYDVLQSTNGWELNSIGNVYSRTSAVFNISMYKPTGVFYLTMSKVRFEAAPNNSKEKIIARYKTTPIIPIGNMDRALIVATTTNTNSKKLEVYKELMLLAAGETMESTPGSIRVLSEDTRDEIKNTLENYYKLRELIIAGVKDMNQYKKLVNNRVVYMLGTVQKGELQRESMINYSYDDDDDDLIDDSDLFEDVDMTDIDADIEDSDEDDIIDFGDTDEDIDIDLDEDIELEENEYDNAEDRINTNDSEEMTFEEFFETAKSMGITDENQARAMFISFLNQNN